MPEKKTMKRAARAKRAGKAPTTQAGEFVREEIRHVRRGKHGARSARQAIAIGLSKARRAGVELAPPKPGKTSEATRRRAQRDYARGHGAAAERPSPRRSRATMGALAKERRSSASRAALSRQGRAASSKRSPSERAATARKAARTRAKASRT